MPPRLVMKRVRSKLGQRSGPQEIQQPDLGLAQIFKIPIDQYVCPWSVPPSADY